MFDDKDDTLIHTDRTDTIQNQSFDSPRRNEDTSRPQSRVQSASKHNLERNSFSTGNNVNHEKTNGSRKGSANNSQHSSRKSSLSRNNEELRLGHHSISRFNDEEIEADDKYLYSARDQHGELSPIKNDFKQISDRELENIERQKEFEHVPTIENGQDLNLDKSKVQKSESHASCQFDSGKKWVDLQFLEDEQVKTPDDIKAEVEDPPEPIDQEILDRVKGSLFGMAIGDSLGAHVEFRPHQYVVENPVTELVGGGTWGLKRGQFTDDTSMGLCLANSLIARRDFIPYDQLVRYKWWYKYGYMSSTGQCFDIGAATSESLDEFEDRQQMFAHEKKIPLKELDKLSDNNLLGEFDVDCSKDDVAGNGALMRLAPVPLFFFRNKYVAVEFSGKSGIITHGDKQAYDACRYYGALTVAALCGFTKEQILAKNFYDAHRHWFGEEPLHEKVERIARGSFKLRKGYDGGIRGKGYIIDALEAALWAFWADGNSFRNGALLAVNLGDDTDTTAAIYGQLAGAYYGYKGLDKEWREAIYAREYIEKISKWLVYEGENWHKTHMKSENR